MVLRNLILATSSPYPFPKCCRSKIQTRRFFTSEDVHVIVFLWMVCGRVAGNLAGLWAHRHQLWKPQSYWPNGRPNRAWPRSVLNFSRELLSSEAEGIDIFSTTIPVLIPVSALVATDRGSRNCDTNLGSWTFSRAAKSVHFHTWENFSRLWNVIGSNFQSVWVKFVLNRASARTLWRPECGVSISTAYCSERDEELNVQLFNRDDFVNPPTLMT